ncbi:MAG TPA: amino acid synthesis family protein [Gaiellaceae bacterium]|nr:amino acid synthesis family protein [Gaiellaceae bacterium]
MIEVRKFVVIADEVRSENGRPADGEPLRRVCAAAVVNNPYAGRYESDLSAIVEYSKGLGRELAARALAALDGARPESFGKGAIVGAAGDQEVAVAFLTTEFARPMRELAGGGPAWISSVTKRGAPGTAIDIPLASKDALFVRSHYDAITFSIGDAPLPDEVVVCCAYASRGRLNARVGGLRLEDAVGDGLR